MAKYKDPRLKQGVFDKENMIVHIGGALSKPENIFDLKVIKMPDYTIKIKERESLGNGWYGGIEEVTKEMKSSFIVIQDEKVIGYIINPYINELKLRSYIQPITNSTHKPIKDFIKGILKTI